MAPNYELDCLVKRPDCSVVVKVKVTERAQNSSECSSQRYLLNGWTFCNQTWYGNALSWTQVSCKKIDLLSSSSRSQWGLIWSNMTVSNISTELLIFFAPRFSWMAQHHKLESGFVCVCVKIRLLFQGQDLSEGSKLYWIFMYLISSVLLIFLHWFSLYLFTITNNQTKYNKVGIYWQ